MLAIRLVEVPVGVLEKLVNDLGHDAAEVVDNRVLVLERAVRNLLAVGLGVEARRLGGDLQNTVGNVHDALARRVDALGELAVERAVEAHVALLG